MLETRREKGALVAAFAVALVVNARSLDAVCDDAYICLRHAQNLVLHGSPVYNLGERVEAYTSPLWMALSALLLAFRIEGRTVLSTLGALSAVALVVCVWRLWSVLEPKRPIAGAVVLSFVAASAPIAAWASSGLETILFAALIVLSLAEMARLLELRTRRQALIVGAVVALTILTRPEGVLLAALMIAWLALQKPMRPFLVPLVLAAALPVGVHELWRISYYGELVPNTFSVKTAAPLSARLEGGLRYAWFCAREMGIVQTALLVIAALAPTPHPVLRLVRVLFVVYVAYVVSMGGDFLDLFRFFVPLFPLLFVAFGAAALDVAKRVNPTTKNWALVIGLGAPAYFAAQFGLRARALQENEPGRLGLWIEPLGWTRHYAYEWADAGRYLHAHAKPGDSMAAGFAGAAPYYAELPNVDLFGLADKEVARNGVANGTRPGHMRHASLAYALSRRPTFFMFPDCIAPWRDWRWQEDGYACVETRTPSSLGGDVRVTFLALRGRAEDLVQAGAGRILEPK